MEKIEAPSFERIATTRSPNGDLLDARDVRKKRNVRVKDPELILMHLLCVKVESMDADTRSRVIKWLVDRFGV